MKNTPPVQLHENPITSIKGFVQTAFDQIRIGLKIDERIKYWTYSQDFRRWRQSNPCASVPALDPWLLDHAKLDGPIDYIEFGASESIRWWVGHNRHPDSTFIGFGSSSVIEDSRCKFVQGFFDSTRSEERL